MPKDAPRNKLQDVDKQQGIKSWLDWADLPEPFNWIYNQPTPQPGITVVSGFGQKYAVRVAQLQLWDAQCKAVARLCKVVNLDEGLHCPVD